MSELNIPANWHYPELGEVLDVQGGSQPPKSNFIYNPKEGYIRLLQIRDFGEKPVPTYVPVKKVTKFCIENDVLIARYGASLGRIVTGMRGAYNVALAKVIDEFDVFNNRYLFYLLQTATFQTPLAMLSRSAQNGFAKHEISHIRLPLPPLAEQHRIVAKIEELFSELDKGIETLKTAQQQLKVYRQAVLKYAFEGRLTNPDVKEGELPEGWLENNVKQIADSIQYGYTESSSKEQVGPKFLRITDIQDNKVNWADVPYCRIKEEEKAKYLLQSGDLVFARTGATVGKSFLIRGSVPESVFASYLIRVRFPKHISDVYVWYFFQSPVYWKQIIDKSVGTGQPNVNGTRLGELEVVFPESIEEQLKIVEEIESRLSVFDKIEESIELGLQQAEALRQSILKKAFEGKLVHQDPNDEPASVLLARIKAEREASPEKKARRRKAKV